MRVKELEKILKKAGWAHVGGTNHAEWKKADPTVVVLRHKGDPKKGTAEGILKQAKLK